VKLLALTVAAAGLLLAVDDPAKKELDKFQGTWTLTSEEFEGKPTPPENLPDVSYTVQGDKVVFTSNGKERTATLTLDASKDPKTYDLRRDDGLRTLKGVYAWDGDDLKICAADDQGDRPTELTTAPGSKNRLRVWKRKK
jgi:uncharacterized protein (TIGR03067 family)